MKWITFHGRELESGFDFALIAVPVSRVYGITQHEEKTVVQLLAANPDAGPIRMESMDDFATMLGKVT